MALVVTADRLPRRLLFAATTEQPQPKFGVQSNTLDGKYVRLVETVYPDRFTVVLRPGHLLTGQILLEDTGKPAAGVRFSFQSLHQPARVPLYPARSFAATDSEGRYTVYLPEPGPYRVHMDPPKGSDYVVQITEVDVPARLREKRQTS